MMMPGPLSGYEWGQRVGASIITRRGIDRSSAESRQAYATREILLAILWLCCISITPGYRDDPNLSALSPSRSNPSFLYIRYRTS